MFSDERSPLVALGVLSLLWLGLRVFDLRSPCAASCTGAYGDGLIFDEKYYVNAARVLLGWRVPAGLTYAGRPPGADPNPEHPALGKLLIAGGMRLFGDNPLGWRFASVVFGSLALLALYALVRAAGGSRWLATGASAVMASDNLMLVHGRIATLDIFAVTFALAAAALYLSGRPLAAGVLAGLGACSKETVGYLVVVLALLEVARGLGTPVRGAAAKARAVLRRTLPALVFAVALSGSFLAFLWGLDAIVHPYDPATMRAFGGPVAHLRYIVHYAATQTSPHGPTGPASYPWQWLLNGKQINYYTTTVTTTYGDGTVIRHNVLAYRGAMNPFIVYLTIPALCYCAVAAWRLRSLLHLLAVCWFLGMWGPLALQSALLARTSYLYYMVMVLPALYIATAALFGSRGMPRSATVGWALALLVGLIAYYPIRGL